LSYNKNPSYKPSKGKKYKGVGNTSIAPAPYLTPQSTNDNQDYYNQDYSKFSSCDYEAIPNPSDYASALHVFSNSLKKTIVYDNASVVQYSKILHKNGPIVDGEIYSDPGHSEADIYDYFKKKKFHIIKRDSVRFVASYM